jgi:hypothetical protein
MTAAEGGAYVLQEVSGVERRVAHNEHTRIDRPAHVGDRIQVSSWMTEAALSLFETWIKANGRSRPR